MTSASRSFFLFILRAFHRLLFFFHYFTITMITTELHTELEMASIDDKIVNIIAKLEKREGNSEKRIDDLEAIVRDKVDNSIGEHLARHGDGLERDVKSKMSRMQDSLEAKMENLEREKNKLRKKVQGSSTWQYYFWALSIVLVAAIIVGYRSYMEIRKKHFL
jgi:hypothetical protein